MRRREFISLLCGAAAAWPLDAHAQHGERSRRIGVLMYWSADDAEGQARHAAFTQALKQLGWDDGRNLRIDSRWATAADIRRHATELVALAPDVLVAASRRHLDRIAQLFQAGAIRPPEIKLYRLSEAADAHRLSESRHFKGKLVFQVR
jgi:NADPH:quinone reductase-like Zn-dependent oxidoreductase